MKPAHTALVAVLAVVGLATAALLGGVVPAGPDAGGAPAPRSPGEPPTTDPTSPQTAGASGPDAGTASPDVAPPPVTVIGVQGGGAGWHENGRVHLVNGTSVDWTAGGADSYFDVTALGNGSVLAAFLEAGYSEGCGPYGAPCVKTGYRVIEGGPDPTVTREYAFPVRRAHNREVHDAEPLPGGGVLLTDMDAERIAVVNNGTVTWQWNASSFYAPPPDPTRRDWLHVNDVDAIGDGRFLVSVRNANQLLVVERGAGVVEVVNADRPGSADTSCVDTVQLADFDGDGSVRCGDPDTLDHQHNPQWLGEGHVLVSDSDNDRVLELRRTEGGQWRPVWEVNATGGTHLDWPRDADRLPNGNTLITDTLNKRVVEVAPNGTAVWSVRTELVPYEADRVLRDRESRPATSPGW